ncbi:MAG: hypothetical protein EAZ57_01595 [Cytophagales bacterium]|nr:MAG: hypothetical protein EAZ67_01680 [Cytophagales bacterium]TAF62143.1 MAG: hypothetical protein EAZ57_01595 [Cytophagales bacterium]
MKRLHQKTMSLVVLLTLSTVLLVGAVLAENMSDSPFIKELKLLLADFSKSHGYERVHLHLDKTLYKPGETIWFQAYARNETDLQASSQSEILWVEFISPKGNVEKTIKILLADGVGGGDFELASDVAGGLYTLKAYTNWQKNHPQALVFEKQIQVQKVILPRLKMKLDFEKDGYGPGDEVTAKLEISSLENKAIANQALNYKLSIQGQEILSEKSQTGADGKCNLTFQLPKNLASADGMLNVLFSFNNQRESISRSVPITLQNIALSFFPEGGEMLAGSTAKVAFSAKDEFGKASDVEGEIIDQNGQVKAKFASFHKGMGAFSFTPEANQTYKARITKPLNVQTVYNLPEALPAGFAMQVKNQTSSTIDLQVQSSVAEESYLIAHIRGVPYFSKTIPLQKGSNMLSINTEQMPAGVLQITLFDNQKVERAERLAFVNKNKQLNIKVSTDKSTYKPREKVQMTISVTDDRGIPMPAQLSLAVVDDKLLSFADDKSGHLLSKMLLEPDLAGEVEEPQFYFDPKEAKATEALDLLMLTQGWRTFTWEEVRAKKGFTASHNPEKQQYSGTVYNSDGKPMSGIAVKLLDKDTKIIQQQNTNSDGYFEFRGFPLHEAGTTVLVEGTSNLMPHQSAVNAYAKNANIYLYQAYVNKSVTGRGAPGRAFKKGKRLEVAGGEMMGAGAEEGAIQEEVQMAIDVPAAPNEVVEMANVVVDKMVQEPAKILDQEEARKDLPVKEDIPLMEPIVALKEAKRAEGRKMKENIEGAADDLAEADEIDLDAFGDEIRPEEVQEFYYRTRVFPKVEYKTTETDQRTDFRSTIFWQAVSVDRKGKAVVEFYNSDDITAFRAVVEGMSSTGLAGRADHVYNTILPFSMNVKAPLFTCMGDQIAVPLTLTNNTDKAIEGTLTCTLPKSWAWAAPPAPQMSIAANTSKTVLLNCNVQNIVGKDFLQVSFKYSGGGDNFKQEIETSPKGFPASINVSGQELEKEFAFEITTPVKGSITASVTAYPTVLSDMMAGIESILQQPYGCFEQTSSSTYPNIMVLEYMNTFGSKNQAILTKAKGLIDEGYKRLTSFETSEKGYEWFGSTPAHEALTAYGLMEFKDMQKAHNIVDDKMIQRTADWLLSRRDGQGGFKRSAQALDAFGRAEADITNAYIVYAMAEAGSFNMEMEAEAAHKQALKTLDPYCLSMVANTFYLMADRYKTEANKKHVQYMEMANTALQALNKSQKENGAFVGKRHSITCSTGQGLEIETTALAILANLRAQSPNGMAINSAVKFLMGSRSPYGGFGNTQSTVLALKALTMFANYSKRTAEAGTLEVSVDGKKVAAMNFEAGREQAILIEGLEKYLREGKNRIKIQFVGVKNALPYNVRIDWASSLPQSSKNCKVSLETTLAKTQTQVGEVVRLSTKLTNITKEGLPMTLAMVGIPGGLSPQPWQLKELQEKKIVDFYEVRDNFVVFYYRQMKPSEVREINLDLKVEVAGSYEAAASSAFLYYTHEHKVWVKSNSIQIKN